MTLPRRPAQELVARGVGEWERDDFESALETFVAVLEEHPEFADVHNKAGLAAAMLGRNDTALRHFDAAIERNPRYGEAHLNRGIVLNELGEHEEARAAFAIAAELDDDGDFPSELGNRIAVAHGKLGDLYLAAGQGEMAIGHYQAGLAVRPHFVDIRGKLAEALVATGALVRAREELDAILEVRPSFVAARIRLGAVLQRLGEREAAIVEWTRCVADAPGDSRPRAYLASVGAGSEPSMEGE